MKKEDLFEAMGDIDEFYIKESEVAPTLKINLFDTEKTLVAVAALIIVFGVALILPRLIHPDGISPVDTGNPTDTTDTTLDTAIEYDHPANEEIIAAYEAACEAASWFRESTLGAICGDKGDHIVIDGQPYWRVTRFETNDEFKAYLLSLFSDKLAAEFVNSTSAYVAQDGKLYSAPADAGNYLPISEDRISDISHDDEDTISLLVTYDIYDYADRNAIAPTGQVIGAEMLLFLYEKVDGKWVFTTFPKIDSEEFYEKYNDTVDNGVTDGIYTLIVDDVNIPLPGEYMNEGYLNIITGSDNGSLITLYCSPQYLNSGRGEILRLHRYTKSEYETNILQNPVGNVYSLACDGEYYYAMSIPTDLQIDPTDAEGANKYEELAEACRTAIREYFAKVNGFTPIDSQEFYTRKYTYYGEHHLVRYYPYGKNTRAYYTLVLSQPAKQGDGGIWCVERWYDLYPVVINYPFIDADKEISAVVGNIHLTFPESGDLSSVEYYAKLQEEFDKGEHAELSYPLAAARAWVTEVFGDDMGYVAGYLENADEYGLPEGEWTY